MGEANTKISIGQDPKSVTLSQQLRRISASVLLSITGAIVLSSSLSAEPFPYKYLSTEENAPFLKYGSPPRENKHKVAAKRWPDVRACLEESERSKTNPDIRKIDWDQLNSVEEADVCLFRIFSSIGSMEGSIDWLKHHGFKTDGPRRTYSTRYHGKSVKAQKASGRIEIGPDKGKAKFPTSYFSSWWVNYMAYAQEITVVWTFDGKIVDTKNLYLVK